MVWSRDRDELVASRAKVCAEGPGNVCSMKRSRRRISSDRSVVNYVSLWNLIAAIVALSDCVSSHRRAWVSCCSAGACRPSGPSVRRPHLRQVAMRPFVSGR